MSAAPATRLACAACGAPAPAHFTWRCPAAGADDLDHRMARTLDKTRVTFPRDGEPDPFVRFRQLMHVWQVARAGGMADEEYVALVQRLEARIAAVDGRGFAETPFARAASLGARLGFAAPGVLWVKDETGSVSGSHKGRHLMGLALALEVAEWLDPAARSAHQRHGLAIASCGNAALAAAVLARATDRPLTAFIPVHAEAAVVARLEALGANIVVCPRTAGVTGDPTMHAFRRATAAGAVPFCCQAAENGLTVEGGETLAWELAAALAETGEGLDRLFVQVGGGALISACVEGLREAVAFGVIPGLPRIHAVQSASGHPLVRAYRRVRGRILGEPPGGTPAVTAASAEATLADILWHMRGEPKVAGALSYAMRHRSEFMSPWETTPHGIAHGILDDETYDWHLPVAGMIESGGFPVVVDEAELREATALAVEATGIPPDPTGAAGLAGAMALRRRGLIGADERVAVLFTGARR